MISPASAKPFWFLGVICVLLVSVLAAQRHSLLLSVEAPEQFPDALRQQGI